MSILSEFPSMGIFILRRNCYYLRGLCVPGVFDESVSDPAQNLDAAAASLLACFIYLLPTYTPTPLPATTGLLFIAVIIAVSEGNVVERATLL